MAGETSLTTLLRSMTPALNEGAYVFCSLTDASQLQGVQPLGSFQERERPERDTAAAAGRTTAT